MGVAGMNLECQTDNHQSSITDTTAGALQTLVCRRLQERFPELWILWQTVTKLILEINVYVCNLKCNPQENLLKVSITFLFVGTHRKCWVSVPLEWSSQKCHQTPLNFSASQGLCSCSLQAGRTSWEMSCALPSTAWGWAGVMNISRHSNFSNFSNPFWPRSSDSQHQWVPRPLFCWIDPAIRDVQSGRSPQTLCFIEIWNYLSCNETNVDNSIPSLHGNMPCPSPRICSWGVGAGSAQQTPQTWVLSLSSMGTVNNDSC